MVEKSQQFSTISNLIREAKQRAYHAINQELVNLYWQVGEYVSQQLAEKAWGKSVVKELSEFINRSEPNIVGFSPQNIWRMKQFYEVYKDYPKLSAPLREISWTSNTIIFSRCKSPEEREFYLKMSLEESLKGK